MEVTYVESHVTVAYQILGQLLEVCSVFAPALQLRHHHTNPHTKHIEMHLWKCPLEIFFASKLFSWLTCILSKLATYIYTYIKHKLYNHITEVLYRLTDLKHIMNACLLDSECMWNALMSKDTGPTHSR